VAHLLEVTMYQNQYFFPPPPWFFTAPPILPQPRTISDNDTIINQGGIQGIQGIQGLSGEASAQSIQGLQGLQGLQGIDGLGVQGIQGIEGIGTQGIQGTNGIDGIGVQGVQGTNGLGIQGLTGIQGIQGPSGGSEPVAAGCILPAKVITESYYIQPNDCYIGVLNTKSIEIYLPKDPPKGKMLIIKAQQKQIGNKKIYIVTQNGDKIDDGDEIILQSPYESITLIFNDSWHITGQAQV
jgi:hypothetical protein